MSSLRNVNVRFGVIAGLMGLLIMAGVLYQQPRPGVADQGDFDRVMNVSGLRVSADDINNPEFVRFLKYTVTDYEIVADQGASILQRPAVTSMAYIIRAINQVCLLLGKDTFKTDYLAAYYAIAYTFALGVILACLPVLSLIKRSAIAALSLLVFFDGNYLVWMNSLYGEPMMITSLALFIAAWMYYIRRRHTLQSPAGVFPAIIFIFAAALLLLGSKLQALSAWPVILIMVLTICWENHRLLSRRQLGVLALLGLLLIVYPLGYARGNKEMGRYTIYNSVFFGILKDSPDPVQDLLDMGLNPDMAADAGKHAFLPQEEYKYAPASQLIQDEFYSKTNNADLVRFYITHPQRLMSGLEYTVSQAFTTSTELGKYTRQYSETPVSDFNRFTLWSRLREKYVPRQLWLLVCFYLLIMLIGALEYRRQNSAAIRSAVMLLTGIMIIGWLQFPMPVVGNGQADTAKQLFLFNFTFDIMAVVSAAWAISRIVDNGYAAQARFHGAMRRDLDNQQGWHGRGIVEPAEEKRR